MNKDRINYLYQVYLDDAATSEELLELESFMADPNSAAILDEALYNSYFTAPHVRLIKKDIEKKEDIFKGIISQPLHSKQKPLWPKIVIAASLFITVCIGVYFSSNRNTGLKPLGSNIVNDIAPGKQGATLTLANGKKIKLTNAANGELAKEAGVLISKSADGQLVYEINGSESEPNKINILSTAKGETYQVRLPDGTLVSLNAASSLEYPANFNRKGERRVKLRGEGYFEVAKDKIHPFIVSTDKQYVEVLGTHFNISSYADDDAIATTLLEGSVKVTAEHLKQILKPGEQAVNDGKSIQLQEADVTEVTAWKNGYFRFNEEKMSSILKKLARWYDVEFVCSDKLSDEEFTGKIARSRNISRVLHMMEKTNSIHFKIEGRRITAIEK